MKHELTEQNLAKFSLLSSVVNLGSAFFTFPLNKMNIRTKAGFLTPSSKNVFAQFRQFYRTEGLRGIYQGGSLLPVVVIPMNFVQNYIYESLNHYLKQKQLFKHNKTLMHFLPVISVMAVTPLVSISAITSMMFSIIHSHKLSNLEAIKETLRKDKRVYIESFKLTAINTVIIMSTRQLVYQHVTHKIKKYGLPRYVNILITSAIVGFAVGVIYQPFQVILTILAVSNNQNSKTNIFDIIKTNGLKQITTRGLKFRIMISMIISVTGIPLYGILKDRFNLNLYV